MLPLEFYGWQSGQNCISALNLSFISNVELIPAKCTNVDKSAVKCTYCESWRAECANIEFITAMWANVDLVSAKCANVDLITAKCANVDLQSDSHFKKKSFYLLQWKPFKNNETCFLFHLKSSFHSQDT